MSSFLKHLNKCLRFNIGLRNQFRTTASNGKFHERMSSRFDDNVPPCNLEFDCAHGLAGDSCCPKGRSSNWDSANTAIRIGPWVAFSFNSTTSAAFDWVFSTICNSHYFPVLFMWFKIIKFLSYFIISQIIVHVTRCM